LSAGKGVTARDRHLQFQGLLFSRICGGD
jgi:hypothetical protein